MSKDSKPGENEMAIKQTQMTIGDTFPSEITPERARALGIAEWKVSDSTIREIEAIESNIRLAESQSGKILAC